MNNTELEQMEKTLNAAPLPDWKKPKEPKNMVSVYNQEHIRKVCKEKGMKDPVFRMNSGTYALHESGAFLHIDKDRRSVKERKRARRVARTQS